jgi:diguanylate cyclase (GGDEF)-like protein
VELPDCDDAEESREAQKLASFCAEQISLAIANVQLREQLTDQSTRDGLTSLFNRRYFIECIRRELNKCSAENPASVISFDVDHFKKFNDNYGHDAGDTVLRTMSQALLEQFRSSDIPCRYGGEEFVIFLPGASADVARLRAEELRCVIENTKVRYSGEELAVTISSGIATFPANGNNVQTLIKSADKALYAAKEGGRNTVRHYEDIAGASPDSD